MLMWPNYASHCPIFPLERLEGISPCMHLATICCGLVNRGGAPRGEGITLCLTVGLSLAREQLSRFSPFREDSWLTSSLHLDPGRSVLHPLLRHWAAILLLALASSSSWRVVVPSTGDVESISWMLKERIVSQLDSVPSASVRYPNL